METAQSSEGSGGGINFQKIAIIIFGFFLLIVLSEGAYFLYTNYLATAPSPTSTSSQIVIEKSPSAYTGSKRINIEKQDLYSEWLRGIQDLEKSDFLVEASLSVIVSGRVTESKLINETSGGTPLVYMIRLEKDGKTLTNKFIKEDFENLKVYLISQGGQERTEITASEIKPGDYAILKMVPDFLDFSSAGEITLEITRP